MRIRKRMKVGDLLLLTYTHGNGHPAGAIFARLITVENNRWEAVHEGTLYGWEFGTHVHWHGPDTTWESVVNLGPIKGTEEVLSVPV